MTQTVSLPIYSHRAPKPRREGSLKVVLCGSYRRDQAGLKQAFTALQRAGCEILSPKSLEFESEQNGFVLLREEETEEVRPIEERHLEAISQADFIWLHAPGGYIGPSGAMEIGFAHGIGVPIYSETEPSDVTVAKFVTVLKGVRSALAMARAAHKAPRRPALIPFQRYYAKVAKERGYDKEGIKECMLLLVEEVGELARALRKKEGLTRDGGYADEDYAQELADVFLYTVHLANVLRIDLSYHVQRKEVSNNERFQASQSLTKVG